MGRLLLSALGAFCLLTAAGPPAGAETPAGFELVEETVAVVNGEPILLSDVRLYQLLFGEKDFRKAVERLVEVYLVAQYAAERGLEIPPQKVWEMVENFAAAQGTTVERLYADLQRLGLGGAVFQNFLVKYNLYLGALQLFVIKPLTENEQELELLLAAKTPESVPVYELEILKVPKEVAVKRSDVLVGMDFEKVSEELGLEPVELRVRPEDLKPEIARVVRRLKPGQTDFAEDQNFIYLVKLKAVSYETPPDAKERALEELKRERVERFVKKLKEQAVVKVLVSEPPTSR